MSRLFVGNFELEHSLADAGYRAKASIARLNAERATSWLAVAEDGDFLWCPEPIATEFFEQCRAQGLPRVLPVSNLASLPDGIELVPWGWTADGVRQATRHNWSFTAADLDVIRTVNSRQFSHQLEREWSIGLPGSSTILDADQFDTAFAAVAELSGRVVIKANWGMAGRERLLVEGRLADAQHAWLRKRIKDQGAVVIEPWVKLIDEVGIQLDIPRHGPPVLVGTTALICDHLGQYRGNWCTDPLGAGNENRSTWQPAIEVALSAAERMQHLGYFGPVGIDAARYRRPDGSVGIRPLQDINARWTMGRLSLGWRSLLHSGERAFWQHGAAGDVESSYPPESPPSRVIETSPREINGRPATHRSRLLIFAGEIARGK